MTTYQHIDPEWETAFILESRALDYSGAAIGSALAEIEAHCAASGEAVADAFGDPREYAASLGLPRTNEGLGAVIAGGLLGFIGVLLIPTAVRALTRGEPAVFTAGQLVSAGIVVAVIALVGIWGPWVFRRLDRFKPWHAGLIGVAVPAAWVGLMLLAPTPYPFPPVVVGIVGVVALIAGVALEWIGVKPDPLTDPLTPKAPSERWVRVATVAIWPVLVVVFSIVAVLV